MLSTARTIQLSVLVLATILLATAVSGITPSEDSPVLDKLFMEPEFEIRNWPARFDDLPADLQDSVAADFAALDVSSDVAFYDLRGGRINSVIFTRPLVPGPGSGNSLSWSDLGLAEPASDDAYGAAVLAAFESFLAANAAALGIDSAELEAEPNVAVHDGRRLTHLHFDREVDGVPVRFSSLTATVNSGNLILYGARNWGAVTVSTVPSIAPGTAEAIVEQHLAPHAVSGPLAATHLEIIPQANGADPGAAAPGDGYTYRLTWVVTVGVDGDHGTYEGIVDAHSGDLLALTDLNNYLDRRTVGGIFPVSNDGLCQGEDCSLGGKPDGVEQPGHPMPFATLTLADGTTVTTNSGGLADFDGAFSSDLTGPYVQMSDNCGFIEESTVCTDLDFSSGPGTDCDVPAGADSLGNTHSSRTGFYELNRVIELVRSRTPASDAATFAFVNGQLPVATPVTSNMNIPNSCNAFFTPALPSINFYREGPSGSGAVICRNTGEIAAVFDHEWGHFLDDFDGNGLSSPSEAYADIVGITRLNDSCVGRGFFKSLGDGTMENQFFCPGDGDPCTECTGVREDDFLKRQSQLPHGVEWAAGNDPDIPGGCVAPSPVPLPAPGLQSAPCGGSVHCNGTIVGESVVDLMTRDLICMDAGGWENVPGDGSGPVAGGQCVGGAAPTMDVNTALELVTQIFYRAKSNIGFWFVCDPTVGGCTADSGYQQFLAADDDNGNLLDGTPHIDAIFAAFSRHQIACPATAPPLVNLSCPAGEPARVTGLTATATVNGADLDWDDVPGALEYQVFRTEGVLGCEQGKTRIAVLNALTDGSQYSDVGNALDGMEQYYTVMAVGAPGCFGDMAECASVVPLSPTGGGDDVASVGIEQGDLTFTGADDGDIYLDNCESARLDLTVANNGSVDLTNVEVIDIRPVSHPDTTILTPMPISLGSLANECGGAGAAATSFDFKPLGMSFDDTLVFEVDVLADELGGVPQTGTLQISQVESDNVLQAEVLFDFEADEQGWTPLLGVFGRTDAGAGGAPTPSPGTFYMASSEVQSAQCDVIRSPALRFTDTSTLSLFNQFTIEPTTTAPYDRANVSLVDAVTGQQFVISPDGGLRPYTIPTGGDGFGSCVTQDEPGWNGAGPGWLDATWSSTAIQDAVTIPAEGRDFLIEVAYGTDALFEGGGFQFDQVRATDVFSRGPDAPGPSTCPMDNVKPDAVDDGAMTDQGESVSIDVLANDSDPDGDVITITNVTNGANGTAVDSGGGSGPILYTPDPGFFGTDTFTYTICDDGGPTNDPTLILCDSATVTVLVKRVIDSCFEPGEPILDDPEGDVGIVVPGTGLPQHDVLSLEIAQDGELATGTFIFTLKMVNLAAPLPNDTTWPAVFKDHNNADRWVRMWTDEVGTVAFAYGNGTNPGPFGNPGTPADPSSSFAADGTIRIVVPSSAFPGVEEGDTFSQFITRIRIEAAGSALTPDNMPDGLVPAGSYTVTTCPDGNRRPNARDDAYVVADGTTRSVPAPGVLGNDDDPDGDALIANLLAGPGHGTLTLGADGSFDYTPDANSCDLPDEDDSFTYEACDRLNGDPDQLCDPATVTLDVSCDGNVAPVANDDAYTVDEDEVLTVAAPGVLGNDTDADGDALTAVLDTTTTRGTLALASDGSFTYTPEENFHGTDSFTYFANDGQVDSEEPATVTITVEPVNDPPVADDDAYETDEDTLLVVDATNGVLVGDEDVDGDALRATLVSGPANGDLVLAEDGSFTYTPDADYNGGDSFVYRACDRPDGDPEQLCDEATVSITVDPQPDFPTAADDTATTSQDTPVTIDVLANDNDVDGENLTVDEVTQPAFGTAVNNGTDVTYVPNPGFVGMDSFTYTSCDPTGRCDTATVTVTVEPVACPGDDDDFDSDGVRDDVDSDDDGDGDSDGSDSDDDNDGDSDGSDSDDDNDCIDDDFDNQGMQENQSRRADSAPANGQISYTVTAGPLATLLVQLVEGPVAESLVIEVYDPNSTLVATSVPTPGQALATLVPAISGEYTVTVSNPTPSPIAYTLTSIVRKPW